MSERSRIAPDVLRALARDALVANGVAAERADRVADVLVDADARGVVTHGVTRLASYVERVRLGLLDPDAAPEPVVDRGALVLLDGRNGFGAVAGTAAADLAAERAREHGCAWVTVRASNHVSMLGYYTRRLAAAGLAALMWSNAGASVAAWGGRRPVVGTNPLSLAAPGDPDAIVLDIAMTAVARGKIRRAAAEGRPIPEGLAFDAEGEPTTDARAALAGTLAPMGGHKGYGLSALIDLLSGVVSGGAFSAEVRTATDTSGLSGVCFTIVAADVAAFLPDDAYRARLGAFRDAVLASAEGEASVHLPGDLEDERARMAAREGIEVPPDVMEALQRLLDANRQI